MNNEDLQNLKAAATAVENHGVIRSMALPTSEILALIAEVEQARETNGWFPIESAPKDGRKLLLGAFNALGKWRTMRGQWISQDVIDSEWEDPDGVEEGWFETPVEADAVPNCWPISPTHYQPMPKQPQ